MVWSRGGGQRRMPRFRWLADSRRARRQLRRAKEFAVVKRSRGWYQRRSGVPCDLLSARACAR